MGVLLCFDGMDGVYEVIQGTWDCRGRFRAAFLCLWLSPSQRTADFLLSLASHVLGLMASTSFPQKFGFGGGGLAGEGKPNI